MDLSFAKNMGTHLNNKYIYKLLDSTEKSTTGVIKTASKKAIEKKNKTEATGDFIDNKIANKITSGSKSPWKLYLWNNLDETDIPREKWIFPEKRKQIIDEFRLT